MAGVFALSVLALVGDARAQGTTSLTPQEFLARIDGNLPALALEQAAILSAEAAVEETRTLAPLSLSYEREEVFTQGEGVALKDAVSVGWSLDISGRRKNRTKSANLTLQAVRESGQYKKQLVLLKAMAVYKRAARARLRVASLQDTRQPLVKLVERLNNRVAEGDASGYDLARFELQLTEHEDLLVEASAEMLVAQTELAGLLGAGEPQIVASDNLDLPTLPAASLSPGSALRSDLGATEHEEESGKALVSAAGSWWVPTLDLSFGYLHTDFGPGTGPGADSASGYSGMISASIPLFSRGKAEKKQGQARIRHAQVKRRILERRITTQVQTARTRLSAKLAQTRKFKERQLVQSAELVRKTEAAYQGGEASSLELRDAYGKVSEAQLRYIELRYQCSLARLALQSATGTSGKGETK